MIRAARKRKSTITRTSAAEIAVCQSARLAARLKQSVPARERDLRKEIFHHELAFGAGMNVAIESAGIILQPALAAIFMSLSTVIVAINAVFLRRKNI